MKTQITKKYSILTFIILVAVGYPAFFLALYPQFLEAYRKEFKVSPLQTSSANTDFVYLNLSHQKLYGDFINPGGEIIILVGQIKQISDNPLEESTPAASPSDTPVLDVCVLAFFTQKNETLDKVTESCTDNLPNQSEGIVFLRDELGLGKQISANHIRYENLAINGQLKLIFTIDPQNKPANSTPIFIKVILNNEVLSTGLSEEETQEEGKIEYNACKALFISTVDFVTAPNYRRFAYLRLVFRVIYLVRLV